MSRIGKPPHRTWRDGKQALNVGLMTRKRRSLVLTNEAARHPFRASLPVAVAMPRVRSALARSTGSDVRDFVTAFVATFVVVSVFIG